MSKWISLDEKRPSKSGDYLVYSISGEIRNSYYTSSGEFALAALYGLKITHWMPLPKAPTS